MSWIHSRPTKDAQAWISGLMNKQAKSGAIFQLSKKRPKSGLFVTVWVHLTLHVFKVFLLLFSQAAFVPASDSVLDTSYFTSRYSWTPSDGGVYPSNQFEDSGDSDSMSDSSGISNRPDEVVSNIEVLSFHIVFVSMQLTYQRKHLRDLFFFFFFV